MTGAEKQKFLVEMDWEARFKFLDEKQRDLMNELGQL